MKTNYIFYFAFLSTLFFLCFASVAQSAQGAPLGGTPVTFSYGDGLTWSGELGQSVHVEYSVNDKISQRDGTLSKVATRYIYVGTHGISIKNIILIQNSETTTGESPPTAAPPNESSSEVSKDEKDNEGSDWVVVRGVGITSDEAKQDAWRNAIEQVAGVYITANSLIENGKLVKDVITSHSNAYIEHVDLLETEEDIEGGFVRVRMRIQVATKSMFEKLQSAGGELKFRSVDGESKYAKIVTQKQQTKSAIETLPAAMEGYPEELIDIKIGKTRMAMKGVFNDGKEHLIVPLTFSWNNNAWTTFANNLNQYLKHVSSDSESFKLRLQGLKIGGYAQNGKVDASSINKDSGLQVGWERELLKNSKLPTYGKYSFDYELKGMYDGKTVRDQVVNSYKHDHILDVVVILDNRLKNGKSYAVSRDIWDSLLHRMKQTPAFYLNAISKIEGVEIGQPDNVSEFTYSVFRWWGWDGHVSSLPIATGYGDTRETDLLGRPSTGFGSVTDIEGFDRSDKKNSPRVMLISPFFNTNFGVNEFNYSASALLAEFSYDYSINLELEEVDDIAKVEIETYVLDLHNKKRRDNGSQ